ncbi:MAG: OmpA family protein [Alphaproteobacteria bacterium]|nr:OmpA family protein [Alphaproteobacteria bacterium]
MANMLTRVGAVSLLAAVGLLACFGNARVGAQQGMTLDVCPTDYGSFPDDAPTLTCGCTPAAVKAGNVYGANPYYWQSSPCRAAFHAGAIGAEGGQIVIQPKRAPFFPAVTRNGVAGSSYPGDKGFQVVVTTTSPPQAPPGGGASTAAAGDKSGMTLDVCPSNYGSFPEDAPALTCGCTSAAIKSGSVYGANPYYWQSSVCRAAYHAGAIGAEGGQIVIRPKNAPFFPAVPRNGIAADSYMAGRGFQVVVAGASAPQAPAAAPGTPAASAGMTLDNCPVNYGSFPDDAPSLACGCTAAAIKTGSVYGGNPYYWQSSVCRAAYHAGAIGAEGGQIVIQPKGAPFFPAVPRNGIAADSYMAGKGFLVVLAAAAQTPTAAAGTPAASAGMTLDNCPVNYGSFPEDAPSLACGCSAAAVKAGNVYGANPYYWQSSPCRAALHAGAVGAQGGQIVIKPKRAPFFPAVARNGVTGTSYPAGQGFEVVVAPPATAPAATPPPAPAAPPATQTASAERPSVDMTGKPIQAPVAETLRKTGRVQLYVNFATDQEKPLPSSEPVLQELLATLQGDGTLRVMLIGHTDNQGGAPYNLDLSQRRAAAVYLWLIQHGIDSGRLRSDGRGLMEPIADNATEWGRALNRRVEVQAIR